MEEIQNIFLEIEANPSLYLLEKFPKRKERLRELKKELKTLVDGEGGGGRSEAGRGRKEERRYEGGEGRK